MRDDEEDGETPKGESPGQALAAAAAFSLVRQGQGADAGTTRTAEAYLREATRLARLQSEELHEARSFAWLEHFSAAMKAGFEGLVAILVLGIAIVAGSAVWNAAHDNSLVIQAFSVLADLSARGLTGHVVAAQIQDKLADMQAQTNSMRAAGSYQNNWGDDIQVQIPDTGVSLGQINRYLHDWLGHRTYISGEIFGEGDTLTVTARIGSEPAQSVSGKRADFDQLLQKAAEAVYGKTQPYRYAVYLLNRNRLKEATAAFTALAANGDALDRAWAYVGLYNLAQLKGDVSGALKNLNRALAVRPDFVLALINRDGIQSELQHTEAAYRTELELARVLHDGAEPDINPAAIVASKFANEASLAGAKGDYLAALGDDAEVEVRPDYSGSVEGARRNDAAGYAFLHDGAAVRRALAALSPPFTANERLNHDAAIFLASALVGDWRKALATFGQVAKDTEPLAVVVAPFLSRGVWPLKAYAMAMSGDIAGAKALLAKTPLDCDACLRARIRVAMAEHDWKAAEHWATLCTARTPSLPQCVSNWGDVLRAKGDDDGAIAKYRIAHARGPHFADPLEGWGEALILKNRSDLALAKFEEAARYAPNWGRLHFKWGEALLWSGDKTEAQKQFAIAAHLALTPPEKSQLARVRG